MTANISSTPETPNATSASSVLDSWTSWLLVERGLAQGTVRAYRREIDLLAEVHDRRPDELGADDLRAYLYQVAGGGSAGTVARRIAALSSFYRWLVRTDRRADDPTQKLDRPRIHRRLPRPVDDLEERLDRLEPDFRALAVFLAATGLRISEACAIDCGLPVPDALRVRGKGDRERVVPLTDVARAALSELGGRVPWKPRTVERHFQMVGMKPHALRHTFATRLADADVDVTVIQDLLGHASPATTRIYQRNSPERLRRGMERGLAR